ncbi:hypothetical protein [Methylomonas sp. DH-1]|uniref:hypothetical protein n=1 Tax=Methylomonas sp. (strain DH-1) TaxID=1727196 RepID=UPI0012F6D330|nr:hypothetical protein [Methylomonas sp. DH-1]
MTISHSLFIKYGLQHNPTEYEIVKWLELTQKLINSGASKEEAGQQAAKIIFRDFNSVVYCSEADTIEALLAAARNRHPDGNG